MIEQVAPQGSDGQVNVANDGLFTLFGGINVLESRDLAMKTREEYVRVAQNMSIPYVLKAYFDKANRSSINSYRGPGLDEGLKFFKRLRRPLDCSL
jgi:2-dehydro-3-deoxyphosphooctonate aldolase (KDO 8-P synthase)